MKEKVFKECAPVYDEECNTTYQKHCKVNKKCVQIYQTQCHNSGGYSQTCSQVPAQTCYPETVCHRTPQTKCYQTRSQKCTKVVRPVPVEQESHTCLPFPAVSRPQPVITPDICSAQHSAGEDHEHHGQQGGYVAPHQESAQYSGGVDHNNDGYGTPVSGLATFESDEYGAPVSDSKNGFLIM